MIKGVYKPLIWWYGTLKCWMYDTITEVTIPCWLQVANHCTSYGVSYMLHYACKVSWAALNHPSLPLHVYTIGIAYYSHHLILCGKYTSVQYNSFVTTCWVWVHRQACHYTTLSFLHSLYNSIHRVRWLNSSQMTFNPFIMPLVDKCCKMHTARTEGLL